MSIFDKMQQLTKGKNINITEESEHVAAQSVAKVGDTITGIITKVQLSDTDGTKGGFGFIASPSLPFERIFFHWSGLRQDTLRYQMLRKKMQVEFVLQFSEKSEKHEGGYRAVKIRVL